MQYGDSQPGEDRSLLNGMRHFGIMTSVFIFKRNTNAFSLNAIIDARRRRFQLRRHENNLWTSNFNIYHNVAHGSCHISTLNDITTCFRPAANRTNVSIFGHARFANY